MAIAIIFSKDRACQLHLLLESIYRNVSNDLFSLIHIIYKSSNQEYENAYLKLKNRFDHTGSTILLHKECDFKQDLLCILKQEQSYGQKYTCFFTDDDIVYQPVDLSNDSLKNIFDVSVVGALSLRLGRNIILQDIPTNMSTYIPEFKNVSVSGITDPLIMWSWRNCPHHLDFGYPLSVDGHFFRISDIILITESVEASNPNIYEGQMCHKIDMLPPLGLAYQHSKVVNTPINRVQDICTNRFGNIFPRTQEELNIKYLDGYIIDYDKMDFSNIYCAHQELIMEFK